jgi:hypothetical protein
LLCYIVFVLASYARLALWNMCCAILQGLPLNFKFHRSCPRASMIDDDGKDKIFAPAAVTRRDVEGQSPAALRAGVQPQARHALGGIIEDAPGLYIAVRGFTPRLDGPARGAAPEVTTRHF